MAPASSLESVPMVRTHNGKAPQGVVLAVAFHPRVNYSRIDKSRPRANVFYMHADVPI
jgi:hypothetical protein